MPIKIDRSPSTKFGGFLRSAYLAKTTPRVCFAMVMILLATDCAVSADKNSNATIDDTKPVYVDNAAVNDVAQALSLDHLSLDGRQKVLLIRRVLKENGFRHLSLDQRAFAWGGDGRECLWFELVDGFNAQPDKSALEAKKLLGLSDAQTLMFACDSAYSDPGRQSMILRIGKHLVNRDARITPDEASFAKNNFFLVSAYKEYIRLGIDPAKVADREKAERDESQTKLDDAQKRIPELKSQIPKLQAKVKQLNARLDAAYKNPNVKPEVTGPISKSLVEAENSLETAQLALGECESTIRQSQKLLGMANSNEHHEAPRSNPSP